MALTLARINFLANEWRETVATDTAVQTEYLLAPELIVDTLLDDATEAATEATRVQALRGSRRNRYEFTVPLDGETINLDLGSYIKVQHTRFGLTAGQVFTVISVEPDAQAKTLRLGVWG